MKVDIKPIYLLKKKKFFFLVSVTRVLCLLRENFIFIFIFFGEGGKKEGIFNIGNT